MRYLAVLFLSAFIVSCVPQRKFEELSSKQKQCQDENDRLKSENQSLSTNNAELNSQLNEYKKQVSGLITDTAAVGASMRKTTALYNDLNKTYEKLIAQNEKLTAGNMEETKKIIAKLNQAQEDLLKKEDQLKKLATDLNNKEKDQAETAKRIQNLEKDLEQRETKLKELTSILHRKDSVVNFLKNSVTSALLGFKDMGLSIQQKNGKVYVSLEERLLFKSGSITVDSKGEDAIRQLSKVLEKNPDVSILIEGHTDNVPFTTGGSIKDNWDLSVLRATSVVRIIMSNSKVDPKRLTAAGRSEFLPLDPGSTSEARKKNRRIEIILSPKLDELLKILETN